MQDGGDVPGGEARGGVRLVVNGRFLTQRATGVQRWALEVTRQLVRRLGDVVVVVPRRAVLDERAEGLPLTRSGGGAGHLWEQFALPRFVRRTRASLLFSPANTGPLAIARQVITVHDVSFLYEPRWFSRSFRLFYGALVPRLARRVRLVLTDSEFSRQEITRLARVPAERIHVVHGAPAAVFSKTAAAGQGGVDYVLAVGSLDPRKNLRRLVAAWQLLDRRDVELRLVGSGDRIYGDPSLRAAIEAADGVSFLGTVSDAELAALYTGARALVFPSLYEGFGFPAVEAMACGCPVVASRAASLPEVCQDAAEYVDPEDEADVARGIRAVLDDAERADELRRLGRERASQFSWGRTGEEHVRLLESLLED